MEPERDLSESFERLFTRSPGLKPIGGALRSLLEQEHEGSLQAVWLPLGIASFGVGPRKLTEHYAYIGVQKEHVNVGFYHGVALVDSSGLMEGTGKSLRHVKVRTLAEVGRPALLRLIRAARRERERALSRG
jgi:Domain of unknown function (DU1801)